MAPIVLDRLEDDPLPLTQGAEHGAAERSRADEDLGAVVVTDDDADAGDGVIGLDHALKHAQAFSTLPARMHEVQTRARLVLEP